MTSKEAACILNSVLEEKVEPVETFQKAATRYIRQAARKALPNRTKKESTEPMGWVSCSLKNNSNVSIGQMSITWRIDANSNLTSFGLQYTPSSAPNPQNATTIYDGTTAISIAPVNGVYSLANSSILANKFTIPAAGGGGKYNQAINVTFTPSSNNAVMGTFHDANSPDNSDADCSWDASAS